MKKAKPKILVSACLLGYPVRYDGRCLKVKHDILNQWAASGAVMPFCPEVAAGMSIPRAPAEIQSGHGTAVLDRSISVLTRGGADVSEAFILGAELALEMCQAHNLSMAVLSDGSPSCGSNTIYRGDFSGIRIKGFGVTTALLRANGIMVFDQGQLVEARQHFNSL